MNVDEENHEFDVDGKKPLDIEQFSDSALE